MGTPDHTTIYALCDPDTGDVRYIGKTTDPKRRYYEHTHRKDYPHTPLRRWITKLARATKQPTLRIIETCGSDWAARERHWIATYRLLGVRLLNISDGGDGASGVKMTPAQRAHMSSVAKAQGRRPAPKSPEQYAAIAARNRGRAHTPEARAKISSGRQGMRFTPEHRQALSAKKQALYAASSRVQDGLSRRYAAITDEQVIEVLKLAQSGAISQREIGLRYGIPASTVSEIKSGKRYKHVARDEVVPA